MALEGEVQDMVPTEVDMADRARTALRIGMGLKAAAAGGWLWRDGRCG